MPAARQPEGRRQVDRAAFAGPARHLADRVSCPGLYETSSTNVPPAHGVVDPVRCPVTDSPADCAATRSLGILIGNPDLKPETSTTLHGRRDLGAVSGTERHARLLEHPRQGADHVRQRTGDRQRSCGASRDRARHQRPSRDSQLGHDPLRAGRRSERQQRQDRWHRPRRRVAPEPQGLGQPHHRAAVDARLQATSRRSQTALTYNYDGTQGNYDVASSRGYAARTASTSSSAGAAARGT